jgi:hypothetical protein
MVVPAGFLAHRGGLRRDGGLDPDGLDHLLHDTAATLCNAVAHAPADLAAGLAAHIGSTPGPALTPTQFRLAAGPASATVDLAAATVTGALTLAAPLPVAVTISAGPTGAALDASVGALDPTTGGLALVGHAGGGPDRAARHSPARRPDPAGGAAAHRGPRRPPPVLTSLVSIVLKARRPLRGQVNGPVLDDVLAAVGLPTTPTRDRQAAAASLRAAADPVACSAPSTRSPCRQQPRRPRDDLTPAGERVAAQRRRPHHLRRHRRPPRWPPVTFTGPSTADPSRSTVGCRRRDRARRCVDVRVVDGGLAGVGFDGPPVRLDLIRPVPQDPIGSCPAARAR